MTTSVVSDGARLALAATRAATRVFNAHFLFDDLPETPSPSCATWPPQSPEPSA